MEPEIKIPTTEEVKGYLEGYGWNYRETEAESGKKVLLTNFALDKERGILISLHVEGEFIIVTTHGLMLGVDKRHAERLLAVNDTLKLVKLYSTNVPEEASLEINVGFELWAEACQKEVFYAFMDMLCLGIEKVVNLSEQENIGHETRFVKYGEQT